MYLNSNHAKHFQNRLSPEAPNNQDPLCILFCKGPVLDKTKTFYCKRVQKCIRMLRHCCRTNFLTVYQIINLPK